MPKDSTPPPPDDFDVLLDDLEFEDDGRVRASVAPAAEATFDAGPAFDPFADLSLSEDPAAIPIDVHAEPSFAPAPVPGSVRPAMFPRAAGGFDDEPTRVSLSPDLLSLLEQLHARQAGRESPDAHEGDASDLHNSFFPPVDLAQLNALEPSTVSAFDLLHVPTSEPPPPPSYDSDEPPADDEVRDGEDDTALADDLSEVIQDEDAVEIEVVAEPAPSRVPLPDRGAALAAAITSRHRPSAVAPPPPVRTRLDAAWIERLLVEHAVAEPDAALLAARFAVARHDLAGASRLLAGASGPRDASIDHVRLALALAAGDRDTVRTLAGVHDAFADRDAWFIAAYTARANEIASQRAIPEGWDRVRAAGGGGAALGAIMGGVPTASTDRPRGTLDALRREVRGEGGDPPAEDGTLTRASWSARAALRAGDAAAMAAALDAIEGASSGALGAAAHALAECAREFDETRETISAPSDWAVLRAGEPTVETRVEALGSLVGDRAAAHLALAPSSVAMPDAPHPPGGDVASLAAQFVSAADPARRDALGWLLAAIDPDRAVPAATPDDPRGVLLAFGRGEIDADAATTRLQGATGRRASPPDAATLATRISTDAAAGAAVVADLRAIAGDESGAREAAARAVELGEGDATYGALASRLAAGGDGTGEPSDARTNARSAEREGLTRAVAENYAAWIELARDPADAVAASHAAASLAIAAADGDPAAGRPYWLAATARGALDLRLVLALAAEARAQGDWGAFAQYALHGEVLAARDDERAAFGVRAAEVLLATGDGVSALEALDRALAVDPEHPTALTWRAFLLASVGETADAAATMGRLAEALPIAADRVGAWLEAARLWHECGDVEHETAALDTLIALDMTRAETLLRTALGRDPNDVVAWRQIVSLYARTGDVEREAEVLRAWIARMSPGDERRVAQVRLAGLLDESFDDAAQATELLETARREQPADLEVLRAYARLHRRRGLPEPLALSRAAIEVRRRLDADPGNAADLALLADVLELRGQAEGARVIAAVAHGLGVAVPVLLDRSPDGRVAPSGTRALEPAVIDLLAPPTLRPAHRALFRLATPALEHVFPFDPSALRAQALGPAHHPLRDVVDSWSSRLGLSPVSLWTATSVPFLAFPASSRPLAIVVPAEVRDPVAAEFAVIRALVVLAIGLSVPVRLAAGDSALALATIVHALEPDAPLSAAEPRALDAMVQLLPAIPRGELAHHVRTLVEQRATDGEGLTSGVLELATRLAVLVSGDVSGAIRALTPAASTAASAYASSPALARLVRVILSDRFQDARTVAGTDPSG